MSEGRRTAGGEVLEDGEGKGREKRVRKVRLLGTKDRKGTRRDMKIVEWSEGRRSFRRWERERKKGGRERQSAKLRDCRREKYKVRQEESKGE